MSSETNDGRSFWTVCIALVVLFAIVPCDSRAQSSGHESNKCTMQLISSPKPSYPVLKKKQNLKSGVVVDLIVNADGTIKSATLARSSGIKEYDDAVIKAFKNWRYNRVSECKERTARITVNIHPK